MHPPTNRRRALAAHKYQIRILPVAHHAQARISWGLAAQRTDHPAPGLTVFEAATKWVAPLGSGLHAVITRTDVRGRLAR